MWFTADCNECNGLGGCGGVRWARQPFADSLDFSKNHFFRENRRVLPAFLWGDALVFSHFMQFPSDIEKIRGDFLYILSF